MNILLPFLHVACIIVTIGGQLTDFDSHSKLVERFLTVNDLQNAVFYTCWSHGDRMKNMKTLNEKHISATHRSIEDFKGTYDRLKNVFSITTYTLRIGVIFDWSCNEDIAFEASESWIWNASYHWLMIMENDSDTNVQRFLTSKHMNLTVSSEILLSYPAKANGIIANWHIFDVYRTAFEPRGQLMIDAVNETFTKWGNRLWKFDRRSNLQNLTLNAGTIANPYGISSHINGTFIKPTSDEVIKYLKTFNLDRLNSAQKFGYATFYPLTRIVLNATLNVKTTNSWGYKVNGQWDGLVGMVLSGEADFSMCINAFRAFRYDVVDYMTTSMWKHEPCFIFRHPQSSTASVNIFLRPFEMNVWFSMIGVIVLSAFVYYTIIHFESNQMFSLRVVSDIFLLKIGTLCQQGTVLEPTRFSNRLIIFLMFVFSLVMYQFYSSSIVSGLLRMTVMNIDSIQKLEESGLDVGVEDLNILTRLVQVQSEVNPHLKKIYDKKINAKSEYLLAKDGVKKIKNGHYAFFTDPGSSYWLINEIFTEREKCDLSELYIIRPEPTAFLIQKQSPYKKLFNYANTVIRETGLMEREIRIWYAKKPECVAGKTVTEDDLVSVGLKDVASILIFLIVSTVVSVTILITEIIVHRYHVEKQRNLFSQ